MSNARAAATIVRTAKENGIELDLADIASDGTIDGMEAWEWLNTTLGSCPGCNAEAGEECRLDCLSWVSDDRDM